MSSEFYTALARAEIRNKSKKLAYKASKASVNYTNAQINQRQRMHNGLRTKHKQKMDTPDSILSGIDRILSTMIADFKDMKFDISSYPEKNLVVISAPTNVLNQINTKLCDEPHLVLITPQPAKPDINTLRNEIENLELTFIGEHELVIPYNVYTPDFAAYKRFDTKSKMVNYQERNLRSGYARAQFNQRKHMHNIIRIKHK